MVQSTHKLAVQHKPAEVLTENPHTNGTEKTAIKKSDIDEDLTNKHNQLSGITDTSSAKNNDISKHIYFPTWDNKPIDRPAVVSLGGAGVLTHQNLTALIAPPGGGKSSCFEALIANYINPECDSLHFSVDPDCRTIVAVDTERTNDDVWYSFYRFNRRAGANRDSNMRGVVFGGMRAIAAPEKRKEEIIKLLDQHKPGLLLIDGAGDLVKDTNDQALAVECKDWIRSITAQYDLSVFVTLHPNPGSNKPRGHHGSEICREAESVILSKAYDQDIRILTTDFEYGKNRNNPKLTTAFRWSDEHKMFVSADLEEVQQGKLDRKIKQKEGELKEMAKAVLPPPIPLRPTELENALIEQYERSESWAKRKIKDMRDLGLIKQSDDGWYRMVV